MSDGVTVLPATGIISIADLAKYLNITDVTLMEGLNKVGIDYIKLSKFHDIG